MTQQTDTNTGTDKPSLCEKGKVIQEALFSLALRADSEALRLEAIKVYLAHYKP